MSTETISSWRVTSDEASDFTQKPHANSRKRLKTSKLHSLAREVSPPVSVRKRKIVDEDEVAKGSLLTTKSVAAAIEAGEHVVEDHVEFYYQHLQRALLKPRPDIKPPSTTLNDWIQTYRQNAKSLLGSHFVIHQHDHPIAGTHYDLRLQCNPTSSISFAIMYGLPGDPNSRRLNRNATETRVHCLWNHVIETASYVTGSMLIWDSGRYEILPYDTAADEGTVYSSEKDESAEDASDGSKTSQRPTEQQNLARAFKRGKVKLRLHGTRLPVGYTLSLRLSKEHKHRVEQPKKPSRRRRRVNPTAAMPVADEEDSERPSSQEKLYKPPPLKRGLSSLSRIASPPPTPRMKQAEVDKRDDATMAAVASDDENETVRANNAYPGATNDIGSIHQRKWYVSIDRTACGFKKCTEKSVTGGLKTAWIGGFDRFIVGGRDTERSIVTGRLACQILEDEGVVSYVPRGLWRPIDY